MRPGAEANFWAPMLKVGLSNSVYPNPIKVLAADILAVIDTGADACYIDSTLAEQHNLEEVGSLYTHGGGHARLAKAYRALILLDGNIQLDMIMPSQDFQTAQVPHRFLIGMEALRCFDLSICRAQGRVRLEWVDHRRS